MSGESTCPTCGFPLREKTLGGLCPQCLRNRLPGLEREGASQNTKSPLADDGTPEDRLVDPFPPISAGTMIGRYRLVEKIGEGGFGTVYHAQQTEPVRRPVAVKVVKLGMDTAQVVARFEAERQALALMDHPHIARVLDGGATETGRPYFVMELVQGIPITEFCDAHQLAIRERLNLFVEVCRAVQHAHQKGIIHRDLKPSNILVARREGVPAPKVIDFGIAKATQMELTEKTLFTQLNHFVGTPAYMSPEQFEMSGVDVDTRTDIYSLGVLLYELLTGSTPLDTTHLSYEQVCRRIREEEPAKPSTRLKARKAGPSGLPAEGGPMDRAALRREIRGDLDQVVMKALDKDRTRRYETADGLAMDISRYLNNEPVLAVAPSPLYRLQKLARRNRGTFAAITIVFLVMILGAALSTWQAIRATRSEQAQSRLRQEAQARAYAADMRLAQQAISMHNLGRARALLDRHRPVNKSEIRNPKWICAAESGVICGN
jgi:eukaryotic-like serine/threonine-protein kinase